MAAINATEPSDARLPAIIGANTLTFARLWIGLVLHAMALQEVDPFLWRGSYWWTALTLLTVGGITDGADGYIAKRYGGRTRIGALLDPLADFALLTGAGAAVFTALTVTPIVVAGAVAVGVLVLYGFFALAVRCWYTIESSNWEAKINVATISLVIGVAMLGRALNMHDLTDRISCFVLWIVALPAAGHSLRNYLR